MSVLVSPTGGIEQLTAYSYGHHVLGEPRDRGVRLGVISHRGSAIPEEEVNRALADARLWGFLTPELAVYDPKGSQRIDHSALGRHGGSE
jgi:hypothetical protein